MTDHLDPLDRKLLVLLQGNARLPTATLAKRLGVPRTTVASRIARLEKSGVIQGYGVRLGGSTQSSAVRSMCALSVEPKAGPAVIRRLAEIPEIEQLLAVSGTWDYMATIVVEQIAHLDRVLDTIGAIDGVRQTTSALLLATKFDRRAPEPRLEGSTAALIDRGLELLKKART
jgi:DNA-binding Lrp family transcriptional regulator